MSPLARGRGRRDRDPQDQQDGRIRPKSLGAVERLKIRISLAYGRTVRELEETLGADEWADLVCFHACYDLPDGFLVTGQLGTLISGIMGGKAKAEDFVPYYKAEERPGDGLRGAFQFLRSMGYGKKRKPQ